MNEDLIIRRRLPPELLAEMHKCLPLADAINVLVNVPTRAIYQNNSPRMRRTIQRIKEYLKEYINTIVRDEKKKNRVELDIYTKIEWKPQFDTFLRYGAWLTSIRELWVNHIVGIQENFLGDLLLHLANSRSTQMMLQFLQINFWEAPIPIPAFLKQLFYEKQYRIGSRILFESVELEVGNGQTFCIFDGEFSQNCQRDNELTLIVPNKMERNNWLKIKIWIVLDRSKKFINELGFTRRWMQHSFLDQYANRMQIDSTLNKKDNKLVTEQSAMNWYYDFDMFLRRCAGFTQFRNFKIKLTQDYCYRLLYPENYIDFLIIYISNTKHPEEFLESIDMNLKNYSSSSFDKIWKLCRSGIPEGGKFINFDEKELNILSAKTEIKPLVGWKFNQFKMEFTLANIPTNGEYVFDVKIQIEIDQTIGMKIQKRKIENTLTKMEMTNPLNYNNKLKVVKRVNDGLEEDEREKKMIKLDE